LRGEVIPAACWPEPSPGRLCPDKERVKQRFEVDTRVCECRWAATLEWTHRRGRHFPCGVQDRAGMPVPPLTDLQEASRKRAGRTELRGRLRVPLQVVVSPTVTGEGQRIGCPTDSRSIVILRSVCDSSSISSTTRSTAAFQYSEVPTQPVCTVAQTTASPIALGRGVRKSPPCGQPGQNFRDFHRIGSFCRVGAWPHRMRSMIQRPISNPDKPPWRMS